MGAIKEWPWQSVAFEEKNAFEITLKIFVHIFGTNDGGLTADSRALSYEEQELQSHFQYQCYEYRANTRRSSMIAAQMKLPKIGALKLYLNGNVHKIR